MEGKTIDEKLKEYSKLNKEELFSKMETSIEGLSIVDIEENMEIIY